MYTNSQTTKTEMAMTRRTQTFLTANQPSGTGPSHHVIDIVVRVM
jgi:hypothetical protein